jgi:HSP20 family protein
MSVMRFEPFRDPFRELDRLVSMAASGTRAPLGMPMDVYRGEDGSYHVEADLPGVDSDNVEVTVEHGALTIRADRTPHYGESEQVIAAERPQGSFTRQLSLGEGVDSENLTAEYADGVLHVTIPASPKTQPLRVEITRVGGGRRIVSGSDVKTYEAPTCGAGRMLPMHESIARRDSVGPVWDVPLEGRSDLPALGTIRQPR